MTIKDVLDAAREHDDRLKALINQVDDARHECERKGTAFRLDDLDWSRADREMYEENQPIFPCASVLKRRDIGKGKYDYYLE